MIKRKHTGASPSGGSKKIWPKFLLFLIVIVLWYSLLRIFSLDAWLVDILEWIEGLGFWGLFVFMIFYIPSCVLMFPDILPNAAAGAIWGIVLGTMAVSLGRAMGGTVTFLLTRSLANRWVEHKMNNDPKFAAVANAVGREGFRIVLLLRLCPLFPAIMLNYTLGLTRVSLSAYVLGTLIGMIPRTLFVAYIGSGARSLVDLASGKEINTIGNPIVFWAGLVLSLIILILLANKARQIINEATQ